MPDAKKFLDQAGTGYLWGKIVTELNKKGQVNSVAAKDASITVAGTATAPTVGVAISATAGNNLTLNNDGLYVNVPSANTYSITKDTTSTDYAAVYHLTENGTNTGVAINIPKDMVVSSGTVETKSTSGAWGAAGTYLVLTLANATNDTIYIPVGDLIEYVTSGSSSGDMVVVNVDSSTHQVTATITDGTVTKAKLASAVQTSLNNADSALQAADIATGSANGTISVKNSNVAVYGLGSAAYADTTAFDAAGTANGVYTAIVALSTAEIDSAISGASGQTGS